MNLMTKTEQHFSKPVTMAILEIMLAGVNLANLTGFLITETLEESLNYLFHGLTLMLMSSAKTDSIILNLQNLMRSGSLTSLKFQAQGPSLHGIGHLDNSLHKGLTGK